MTMSNVFNGKANVLLWCVERHGIKSVPFRVADSLWYYIEISMLETFSEVTGISSDNRKKSKLDS